MTTLNSIFTHLPSPLYFLQSKTLGSPHLLGIFSSLSTILSLYLCNYFPTSLPIYLLPSFVHSFLFSFYRDYAPPLFISNCLSSFITAIFHFIVSMTFSRRALSLCHWLIFGLLLGWLCSNVLYYS